MCSDDECFEWNLPFFTALLVFSSERCKGISCKMTPNVIANDKNSEIALFNPLTTTRLHQFTALIYRPK